MADEYIRRVEAEEAIEEYCCRMCKDYNEIEGGCVSHARQCPHLSGEEILKPVKAADVKPVIRTKWDGYVCQNCNVSAAYFISGNEYYFDEKPHFCPNCGADM